MVCKVIWTEPASLDLANIRDYIGIDSRKNAENGIRNLFAIGEEIGKFPLRGRVVPEKEKATIREVIAGSYRIVY